MAGSGVFPKVDGDILYAYDVNRFAKASEFIGSANVWIISGTAQVSAGSFVFSGT